ncbi:MAG TPA: hypothetical protein DCZ72_15645 [Armatimonadetes bacterium]|nr:hypothetical protein [Armatimonadota bacterium]
MGYEDTSLAVMLSTEEILRAHARGHGRAMPMSTLRAHLADRALTPTTRAVRLAIRELIARRVPIGSTTCGYYLCVTQADVRRATGDYASRIRHLSRRRRELLLAYLADGGEQLLLPLHLDSVEIALELLAAREEPQEKPDGN